MREFRIVIIVIMVMVIRMKDTCECCLAIERNGLLQINSSIPLYFSSSPWGSNGDNCCNWEGIECDNMTHRVTRLRIKRDSFVREWYLNASLFLPFQQLNQLDLSKNNISGCIHNEDFERLWILTDLELLDLSDNNFDSGILQSLSGFPSLKCLFLGRNKLMRTVNISGSENFKKPENLDLGYNQFSTENVLESIAKIRSLTTLSLDECGLSGNIPASQGLCQLKHLQALYMHGNYLNGNLPWCLTNLTSLQVLDISSNHFSGNVSLSPLKSLTSLLFLNLSDNLFRIPTSLAPLFNLSQLTKLHVEYNKMYADTEDRNLNPKFQLKLLHIYGYGEDNGGPIPKFLYYQNSLEILRISDIKLRGIFPCWLLENNTRLDHLDLTNNSLSGNLQLPKNPHVNLRTLDISSNFINGYIPSRIGVLLPNVMFLNMPGNELSGRVPDSLCYKFSKLYELDISHNNISGTLPKCMGNMAQLGILNLRNNDIFGILPILRSLSIAIVSLSKNRLQGSLKDAFYNCSSMLMLDLSHNNISGSIPLWIQTLSSLVYLDLGYNNFQREIPIELCKLKELSILDLSHNNISGQIPTCLNTTSFWSRTHASLQYGRLEFATKGRTFVYDKGILKLFSGIDISRNNLTGEIPLSFGNLSNIKVLNLSHNGLIGMIPLTFSNLKEIESLDLSHNNLQGTIPRQLTRLTSLEVFNVSYNNLSGETPNRVAQFATFEESCYIGNPFLCGLPLPKNCSESPPSNAKISLNEAEIVDTLVDMESFYVSFGVAYGIVLLTLVAVLCINSYWRRVWFYHVQTIIDKICYFIIDNVIPLFSRF